MSDRARPGTGDRPSTAGVHVTDIPQGKINPAPVAIDETEILIEEYLSPRKLKALTGIDNLQEVKYLEMRVDTSETSLGNFGSLLPNLTQLKLNNSIIASVRDLGSSFPVLRILWMPRCNLEDLDGVTAMTSLKELYLAYNDIADLSPLSMMDKLEIIDLEGNNISDISQVEFLSLCSSMKNLTLDGNPICLTPHAEQTGEGYDYRRSVCKTIPHLKILDDIPTSGEFSLDSLSNFDNDWNFLQELEKDGTIGSLDSMDDSEQAAAPIRPTTGYRPGTSMRPTSAMKRLGTARIIGTSSGSRPKTSQRPASSDSGTCADPATDASDLTTGGLVCGNPSRALRSRKKRGLQIHDQTNTNPALARFKHKPEHSYPTPEEEATEEDSLLDELKQWRLHNESVHKKLEVSRAPNVLTIDHTEDVVDSSDSERDEEDQGFVSRQDNQPSDEDLQLSPTSSHNTGSSASSVEPPPLKPATTIGARRRRYKVAESSLTNSTEGDDDFRPISGPVPATNYKPTVNKHEPKLIPSANGQPVIVRADITSPEKPIIDRPSRTARAAVFSSAALRQHKFTSLPSRPTVPK